MATARRETSDPLPSPLESKSLSLSLLFFFFFFVAVDKTPIGPASCLTRGGSRRDLESEEVTTHEEIFVDAREKEEEDEEVFLEAIQTDRVREGG